MRQKPIVRVLLTLSLIIIAALASHCGTETPAPAATPTVAPQPTATPAAAPDATATVDPAQSPAAGAEAEAGAEPEATGPPVDAGDGISAGEVAAAVSSRTPEPTSTPDVVAEQVRAFTAEAGLSGQTFLGLSVEDWIDIGISLLIIIFGYLLIVLGVKLLLALLRQLASRTPSGFDDVFVETIASDVKWLVMALFFRYALLRLDFWSEDLRTFIEDIFFLLGTAIIMAMVLKLIQAAATWYRDSLEPEKDKERLEPILMILQRSGYALVIIVWISIVLSHLGINITAFSAVLIMAAVIIALGAREVISDAISGFIILIDQPYRVGDVIEIEEMGKWGDVVDIGTRVTRIRTRDYRNVTIPNSKIGNSRVVNYTFPDPKFRVRSEIPVAYGSDFDQVRRIVEEAVRSVEGVLPDQPVDALFLDYGHSARQVQVRWWIDDMHQEWYIVDRVNEALETAFAKAGIEMPVTTRDLAVSMQPRTGEPSSLPGGNPKLSAKPRAASRGQDEGDGE